MASAKKTTAKKPAKQPAKKAVKVLKKQSAGKAPRKSAAKAAPKKDERPFTVASHILVPKHEVLKEDEVSSFFEKYSVQPTNLPTISVSDAALQGMDIKMGDIIKITRASHTAEQSVFYRRVSYE